MKKTVLHVAISGLLGFVALACSQQAQPRMDSMSHVKSEQSALASQKSHQRSLEDAKSIALEFLRREHGEGRNLPSVTVSVTGWLRNAVPSLRSLDSKTQLVDTILYVLNVKDSGGCMLIPGDDRLPTVVGYLPNGNLDLNNVPKESGISLFMEAFPSYYRDYDSGNRNRRVGGERPPSSPIRPLPDQRDFDPQLDEPWETAEEIWEDQHVNPMCPVTWDQRFPYNNLAPQYRGRRALAGCVAIAIGQLMACHRFPSSISNTQLNWDVLTRYPDYSNGKIPTSHRDIYVDHVSRLLRTVGDCLYNDWGLDVTGARPEMIPVALRALGYTHVSNGMRFNVDSIVASLNQSKPVVMAGFLKQSSGHAWLCDGYRSKKIYLVTYGVDRRRREYDIPERFILGTRKRVEYLLHYNWGWGDVKGFEYNGFFESGVFRPKNTNLDFSRDPMCYPNIAP